MPRLVLLAATLVLCQGCGDPAPTTPATQEQSADMRAAADGEQVFSWELLARLKAASGNLLVSPFSVHAVLSMTSAGATGGTEDEFLSVLHAPRDRQVRLAGEAGLCSRYESATAYELVVANRLFARRGVVFKAPFLHQCLDAYHAPLEQVLFPDPGRQVINAWVATKTAGRITDLIPVGGVTQETLLVLVNALYFKGRWDVPFPKDETRDGPFSLSAQDSVPVPFMVRTAHLHIAALHGATLVELPYAGGALAMDVIVPAARDGLSAVEEALDAAAFRTAIAGLRNEEVRLLLPRFSFRSPSTALQAPLQAMGLRQAFTKGDFTPMSAQDIVISEVYQQAFIAVDEEGTVAAAATGLMPLAASAPPHPPLEIRADHPFLFLIRDVATQAIIVIGRLADPR